MSREAFPLFFGESTVDSLDFQRIRACSFFQYMYESYERIAKRPNKPIPKLPEDDLSMETLVRAEKMSREIHPEISRDPAAAKEATRTDVSEAIKRQLLVLVEWAKCIPAFAALSIDDQVD